MPRVRVFLLTCRRPHLLRRALASLRAQTFADWICELHNDDPADPAPARLVAEAADPRIHLRTHERNLGAIATFNLAHAGSPEPFFSILEDDNWWEPDFLETMLAALDAQPDAELAWANMRLWREEADGGWTDTGETIWPVVARPRVTLAWPQLLQIDSPLYSNGAMLARAAAAPRLQTPACTPLGIVENMRERAFRYPLLLVPRPLAHFALTRETARKSDAASWAQPQALLGAAFLKHVRLSRDEQARLWAARRAVHPPATSGLIFAGLLQPTGGWLPHAQGIDFWRFLKGVVRHPRTALAVLRSRHALPELDAALDAATAAACARPQGKADIPPLRLATRAELDAPK